MMGLPTNNLKAKLDAGCVTLGVSLDGVSAGGIVSAAAVGGADFVWVDMEHSALSLANTADIVALARGLGMEALVRVAEPTSSAIEHVLDTGCLNILIPRLRTREDVDTALTWCHYAPRGTRGLGMYGGANSGFNPPGDADTTTQWINNQLVVGLMVETPEALEALDRFVATDIGFVLVGVQDLAMELGTPGSPFTNPVIVSARSNVRDACKQTGVAYMTGGQPIADAINDGAQMIILPGPYGLIRETVTQAAKERDQASPNTRD